MTVPLLSETLQARTFVAIKSAQSKQRTYRAVWTPSRETSSSLLQQGDDPKLRLLLHAEEGIHLSSSVSRVRSREEIRKVDTDECNTRVDADYEDIRC